MANHEVTATKFYYQRKDRVPVTTVCIKEIEVIKDYPTVAGEKFYSSDLFYAWAATTCGQKDQCSKSTGRQISEHRANMIIGWFAATGYDLGKYFAVPKYTKRKDMQLLEPEELSDLEKRILAETETKPKPQAAPAPAQVAPAPEYAPPPAAELAPPSPTYEPAPEQVPIPPAPAEPAPEPTPLPPATPGSAESGDLTTHFDKVDFGDKPIEEVAGITRYDDKKAAEQPAPATPAPQKPIEPEPIREKIPTPAEVYDNPELTFVGPGPGSTGGCGTTPYDGKKGEPDHPESEPTRKRPKRPIGIGRPHDIAPVGDPDDDYFAGDHGA